MEIKDLETVVHILFSNLRKNLKGQVKLEHDFYWYILEDEVYNVYKTPSNIVLGQLDEDLQDLQDLIENPTRALPFHLIKLSMILRALGEELTTFKE